MCDSMMVAVLVTQTANWVKLFGCFGFVVLGCLVSFVYGCILDTINRVAVVCVHGSHPLSCAPVLQHWSVCLSRLNSFFLWSAVPWHFNETQEKKISSRRSCLFKGKTKRYGRTVLFLIKKLLATFFMTLYKDFLLCKIRSARLSKNELSRKG